MSDHGRLMDGARHLWCKCVSRLWGWFADRSGVGGRFALGEVDEAELFAVDGVAVAGRGCRAGWSCWPGRRCWDETMARG